jgi:CRISPR/Cas system-associated protein Cas7 (RAMP superfamily)
MTTNPDDLTTIQALIDSQKVSEIVLDALQEILPHVRGASTAEVMMAYAVMIKSTLIGMEISEVEKARAKELFDQIYSRVLADQSAMAGNISTALH